MNLEFNKLFAALLVAGITAGTAAFVSDLIMHPHELKEDAVPIEGVEVVSGGISGPAGPEPVLHLVAAAEVARGQKLSKACAACHSFDKGGANKIGPNLWNVMGTKMGSKDGFAYSDAMSSFGDNWGYAQMNKFLYKPKQYMPGTKMGYIGIKKSEDRAAVIAWMRTLADSPIELPSDAEIAAEKAELAPEPEVSDTETEVNEDAEVSEGETNAETTEDAQEAEAEENSDPAPSNVEPEAGSEENFDDVILEEEIDVSEEEIIPQANQEQE